MLRALLVSGLIVVALLLALGCTRIDATATPTATVIATATGTAQPPTATSAPPTVTATPLPPTPTRTPTPPTPTPIPTLIPIPECEVGMRLEPGEVCAYRDEVESDFVLAVLEDGSTSLDGSVGTLENASRIAEPGDKLCMCGLETESDGLSRTITALPKPLPEVKSVQYVEPPPSPFLGECLVGMEVEPGELCVYPGSLCAFDVTPDANGHFLETSDNERIEANDVINGELTYNFLAEGSEKVWTIQDVPPPKRDDFMGGRVICPASQPVTELTYAMRARDVRRVQELIDSGVNLDARTAGGFTLLSIALLYDDERLEIVQLLIDAGANVNGRGSSFGTPDLHKALAYSSGSALRMLLNAGANPNSRDMSGYPVLQRALKYGPTPESLENIHALVDAGAEVNATDHSGDLLLFRALLFYDKEIVRALIDRGADIHTLDRYGRPLLYPTLSGLPGGPEKTRLLVEKGADPNARDVRGTPVISRGLNSNWNEIGPLLEAGANPNACDGQGNPPLWYAIGPASAPNPAVSYIENVRLLVEAGADVNARDSQGRTMLERARRVASPEIVQYLIDAGAE